jgi:hypothetical protein
VRLPEEILFFAMRKAMRPLDQRCPANNVRDLTRVGSRNAVCRKKPPVKRKRRSGGEAKIFNHAFALVFVFVLLFSEPT